MDGAANGGKNATAKGAPREHVQTRAQAAAGMKGKSDDGLPEREWIDTLLIAAGMTKRKKGGRAPRDQVEQDGNGPDDRAAEKDRATSERHADANATMKDPKSAANGAASPVPNDAADESPSQADGTSDGDNKRYRRRRCEVPGCDKFARFNNACSGHGGRRLCSQPGCQRVAQFGHKCSAHGGVKYCSVEGCERAVQSRGFCKTHGGGVRCKHPDCKKGAISKGMCRGHGGGSRCAEPGCDKWAQRHGYCVRHSKSANAGQTASHLERQATAPNQAQDLAQHGAASSSRALFATARV